MEGTLQTRQADRGSDEARQDRPRVRSRPSSAGNDQVGRRTRYWSPRRTVPRLARRGCRPRVPRRRLSLRSLAGMRDRSDDGGPTRERRQYEEGSEACLNGPSGTHETHDDLLRHAPAIMGGLPLLGLPGRKPPTIRRGGVMGRLAGAGAHMMSVFSDGIPAKTTPRVPDHAAGQLSGIFPISAPPLGSRDAFPTSTSISSTSARTALTSQ